MPKWKPLEEYLGGQFCFGRLTVVADAPRKHDKRQLICQCDCGATTFVDGSNLKRGLVTSCGCFQRENASAKAKKHGRTGTPEYTAWKRMNQRTTNPNNPDFLNYGARGISVCPEWRNNFEQFYADMGPRPSRKHSIDRIDCNGDYTPSNCRWATPTVQANNRRVNRYVMRNGKRMTITEAARAEGIKPHMVHDRIRKGWPEADWFKPRHPRYSQ